MGQAPEGGEGGGMSGLLMFVPLILIFYFLLIRPQQKRQKEVRQMQDGLKVGDRVSTTGGMHGTVAAVSDDTVTLRVAEKVKIEFDRAAISGVRSEKTESK